MNNAVPKPQAMPPANFDAWKRTCSDFFTALGVGPGIVALVGDEGSGKSYTFKAFVLCPGGENARIRRVSEERHPGAAIDMIEDVDFEAVELLAEEPHSGLRAMAMLPGVMDLARRTFPDMRVVHVRSMDPSDVRAMLEVRRTQFELPKDVFTARSMSKLEKLSGGNPRKLDRLFSRAHALAQAAGAARVSAENVEQADRELNRATLAHRVRGAVDAAHVSPELTAAIDGAALWGENAKNGSVPLFLPSNHGQPVPSSQTEVYVPPGPTSIVVPVVPAVAEGMHVLRIRIKMRNPNTPRTHEEVWSLLAQPLHAGTPMVSRYRTQKSVMPWALSASFLMAIFLLTMPTHLVRRPIEMMDDLAKSTWKFTYSKLFSPYPWEKGPIRTRVPEVVDSRPPAFRTQPPKVVVPDNYPEPPSPDELPPPTPPVSSFSHPGVVQAPSPASQQSTAGASGLRIDRPQPKALPPLMGLPSFEPLANPMPTPPVPQPQPERHPAPAVGTSPAATQGAPIVSDNSIPSSGTEPPAVAVGAQDGNATDGTGAHPKPDAFPTTPLPQTALRRDDDETRRLLAMGKNLVSAGQLIDARAFFKRAADLGNAEGARAMAVTYDPRLAPFAVNTDAIEADRWYSRAEALGGEGDPRRMRRRRADRR